MQDRKPIDCLQQMEVLNKVGEMAHGYSMTIHEKILHLLKEREKEKVEDLVKEHMLIAMDRFVSSKMQNSN